MSLRHAVLGLLSIGPMTGYDLIDYFERSAALVWGASQAQIYPELRRMEADGLLAAKVTPRGERAEKRIYSVTRKGAAELRRWCSEPVDYPPVRDPARLKLSYLDVGTLDDARAFFEGHLRRHSELKQRAELQRRRFRTQIKRRLATRDAADHEKILALKMIAMEGQIAAAATEIAWAKRALKTVDELAGKTKVPSARQNVDTSTVSRAWLASIAAEAADASS